MLKAVGDDLTLQPGHPAIAPESSIALMHVNHPTQAGLHMHAGTTSSRSFWVVRMRRLLWEHSYRALVFNCTINLLAQRIVRKPSVAAPRVQ
mmetsp:Transcript_58579/g.125889  ORF Transcript_58579/g.125889 Transcript_58579/m.125889 type:complete len:92 (-) Transcript_58579:103-378(-)